MVVQANREWQHARLWLFGLFSHTLHWITLVMVIFLGGSLSRSAYATPLGNAVVASPCGEAEFSAALNAVQTSGGGTITFACGTTSIPFTSFKNISSNVVIDGAGAITLDGQQATRFFKVLGGGSLTLRRLVLTGGFSGADYGGALYVNPGGTLILDRSTIHGAATNGWAGGAIIDFQGAVTLIDSVVEESQSTYGAINSTGTLTLIRSIVRNNVATLGGGGLSVGGAVSIQQSLIEGNQAPQGGAIYITNAGEVAITDSHFMLNVADAPQDVEAQGGAIISYGDLRIDNSTFEANIAEGYGGAITAGPASNDAYTHIAASTFVNNQAGERGGAIDNGRGALTVVNSTFSGNSAAAGGAIQNFLGPARLYYVTLADNNGGVGGVLDQHAFAGFVDDSRQRFNLSHTVLAGAGSCAITDTPGPLPHFVSGGYNLSEDTSCAFFMNQTGDMNNTPAQLGVLSANGGSTWTYLPGPASPLVDAAPCLPDFSTDQRGVSRPQGAQCDTGAVEVQPAPPTATPTHTPTATPSPTSTPPHTPTSTPTSTGAVVYTPTSTPTNTPTTPAGAETATHTPTATATWTPPALPPNTAIPTLIPAQIPGGVAVTINVNPNRAYAGQAVTITGSGAPGFNKVRILSVQGGRTVGSSEVGVDAQGNYSVHLQVPPGQPVGPTQLCAVAVGAANAQMACTAFRVDVMPPGQVQGQINGAGGLNAQVNLVDRLGRLRYTAPVNPSGGFQLVGIDPGVYRTVVIGQSSAPVSPVQVVVLPNRQTGATLTVNSLAPGVRCTFDKRVTAYLKLKNDIAPAGSGGGQSKWAEVKIEAVADPPALLANLAGQMLAASQRDHFGVYVSGAARGVVFIAYPQTAAPPQQVIFRLVDVDGRVVQEETENVAPYEATLKVHLLSPSQGDRHPQIEVIPVVNGQQDCPSRYPVHMMQNPLDFPSVKPYNGGTLWQESRQRYEFTGFIPETTDVHFSIPEKPLPYFGAFDNRVRAGVIFGGVIYEDGAVELTLLQAEALVRVLSVDLFNKRHRLAMPTNVTNRPWDYLRKVEIPLGTVDLVKEDYVGLPFLHAPVLDLFGLIQVHVASSGGVTYGIKLSGTVKPFVPGVDATITASTGAQAEIGYGLGVIGGVAAVGYTMGLGAAMDVPVNITVLPQPDLNVPKVCFRINAFVRAWAQYLWGIKLPGVETNPSWKQVLAEYPLGCLGPFAAGESAAELAPLIEEEPLPAIFASPSVASSADGRVLAAYVEDRATSNTSQVQILARFQQGATGQWSAPVALSNPAHSAVNPVALFAGPNALPVVAWAEMPYDAIAATALGNDINAHLRRQEIFYSVYENGAWGAPIRLTDDLFSDGMPAGTGNSAGGLLAWTRDTDANFATRDDQRIGVAAFNPNTARFLAPQFLDGPTGGMNADVRVALAPDGARHLVWISDADASLITADDRRITWASAPAGTPGIQPNWAIVNPQPLPPRVDSPAISVGAAGLELAFLVRQPEADGVVPLLGPNGALWTATFAANQWQAAPVRDAAGGLVFGEQPVLSSAQGEGLLAFRRFSPTTADNAALGQISLARRSDNGSYTAPIYVTDAPQQNWQPALTINPLNRHAVILKVTRPQSAHGDSRARAAIQESQAILAATAGTLSTPGLHTAQDPVEFLVSAPTADPALDPLSASASVMPAGRVITVTIAVRNVGRDPATGMTVTLYQGTPGSAIPLGSHTVAGPLALNSSVLLAFPITAQGGMQPIYAQVITAGDNASPANDLAGLTLGMPTAPITLTVAPSAWQPDALEIAWSVPAEEQPAGYRVLRGTAPGGPFELVGESAVSSHVDTLVERGQTYCYGVQAHNGGALSPMSGVVCGAVELLRVYLPHIAR